MRSSERETSESARAGFDYRRLATSGADSKTARAAVLLVDAHDDVIASGLASLRDLSAQSIVKPYLVACVAEGGVRVSHVADGVEADEDLFDTLHRTGRIDRLDVVSIFSDTLSNSDGQRLAQNASRLVRDCRRLAGVNATVWDHRLSVSAYDSLGNAGFDGAPDTRMVVIPEDRRHPLALARPLYASDSREFAVHVAVEVASICGLWEAADGAALESVRSAASGTGVPLVVLVRSFVRVARLSLPSPAEAIQQGESLPVAAGAMRTPVPVAMTENAVRLLHPQELKWRPYETASAGSSAEWGFWRGLGSRLLSDLRRFPSRLRDRGRSEVSAALDEMADVLRAATPWLFTLTYKSDGDDPGEGPVCDRESRPVEVFAPLVWDDLVQDVLGLADYSEHTRGIRQAASGDERHVLVSKRNLASLPEGPDEVHALRSLCVRLAGQSPVNRGDDTEARAGHIPSQEQSLDAPSESGAARASRQAKAAPESSVTDEPTGSERAEYVAESHESGEGDLLQRLTAEFAAHKTQADRALARCHERLTELAPLWRDRLRSDIEMSRAVPYLLAYGVLLLVLCWTILPRWSVLQIDVAENSWWLSRAWTTATAGLLLALLLLNMPRDTRRRQLYLIGGTTAVLGTSSWLLLEDRTVATLLEAHVGALAPLLAIGLIAVMATSVWLLIGGHNTSSALKVSAALVLTYLMVVLVAVLNDANFTQRIGFLTSSNYRVIVVVTVVAVCLVLASVVVVSLLYYRQALDLQRRRDELHELTSWHEQAHLQADRLGSVLPHWLGTALALQRIIRMPYGAPEAPESVEVFVADAGGSVRRADTDAVLQESPDAETVAGSASRSVLSKFVSCQLHPTEQGQETFQRLLQLNLARPGWLYAQYQRAADAYRANSAAPGSATADNRTWPNSCAYPYPSDEDLVRTVNGDRWPFVQRLHAGDFDPILREHLDAFVAGDGLDELLDEIEAFRIAAGTHPGEEPLEVLSEITAAPDPEIPQSMLVDASLSDLHDDRQMQSYLWWPQRLAVPAGSASQSRTRSLRMHDSVLHQAVRVDLSKPIPLTALTGVLTPTAPAGEPDYLPAGDSDAPDSDLLEPLL